MGYLSTKLSLQYEQENETNQRGQNAAPRGIAKHRQRHSLVSRLRLQDCLQLLFLLLRQARGELDFDAHNEVAPLVWLFALRHAQVWVSFCPGRTSWPTASHAELFAVNGLHGAAPAGERFFEVEVDGKLDIVAFTGEEGMGFLRSH